MKNVQTIAVVGLGYVGLPLACLFSTKYEVIGFDVSEHKIDSLLEGVDPTGEVTNLKEYSLEFTADASKLAEADFVVIAVPTPVDDHNTPDFSYLESASEIIGKHMKKGAIVVYESTVYPGATQEICLPILEEESGKKLGFDFKIGYSPERINPGDKEHTVDKIVKVVSGSDDDALATIAQVYSSVITAGVHKAPSIKVAEAGKVIENIQRDLNIALMNELSIIFERLGIDTKDVLDAAGTKWNFHKYTPGLVGGHCIGVDPYYLTYKAHEVGYDPQVILAGRKINDKMHEQVVYLVTKALTGAGLALKDAKVLMMGLTFKENVPDYRNSRVKQLIKSLKAFNMEVYGYDPLLDDKIIRSVFDATPVTQPELYDVVILVSPHKQFDLRVETLGSYLGKDKILIDVKSHLPKEAFTNFHYVRL